jgi:hypothetical protein
MVLVFKDRKHWGYPPSADQEKQSISNEDAMPHPSTVARLPLSKAVTLTAATDAHIVQYDYEPTAESGPMSVRRRVNVGIFRDKTFEGDIPRKGFVLSSVFFDVDGPDHKWTPEWWAEQLPKLERLRADHPGLLVYVSTGGYRIVGVRKSPFVVWSEDMAVRWKELYGSWLKYLKRRYDIVGDPACDQWNRIRPTRRAGAGPCRCRPDGS